MILETHAFVYRYYCSKVTCCNRTWVFAACGYCMSCKHEQTVDSLPSAPEGSLCMCVCRVACSSLAHCTASIVIRVQCEEEGSCRVSLSCCSMCMCWLRPSVCVSELNKAFSVIMAPVCLDCYLYEAFFHSLLQHVDMLYDIAVEFL